MPFWVVAIVKQRPGHSRSLEEMLGDGGEGSEKEKEQDPFIVKVIQSY